MLVEIPDVGVMIGVFVAFVSGLFAIVIYNKVKPLIKRLSCHVRLSAGRGRSGAGDQQQEACAREHTSHVQSFHESR